MNEIPATKDDAPVRDIDADRQRTLIAYHEAAHAIIGLSANYYPPIFVEIGPADRPDLAGVCRSVGRMWEMEQPWQQLEIGIAGYLTHVAGWLAEGVLLTKTHWPDDEGWHWVDDVDCIDWEGFHHAHPDGDAMDADDMMARVCNVLGINAPTHAMMREIQAMAVNLVRYHWDAIEDLARALDREGRVESLRQFVNAPRPGPAGFLCKRWCRRLGRARPELRALADNWDDAPYRPWDWACQKCNGPGRGGAQG